MGRKSSSSEREKETDELIAQYEAMINENKTVYLDAEQLTDIANQYAIERRFEDAQNAISYGFKLHPGNIDLLIEQAYLYLDTNKLQKAIQEAELITENYMPEVILLKAELMLNEGKLDAAERLFDSIEDKEDVNTILDVAYLYIDMGYPDKALPWLANGLEKHKDNEELLSAIADCYCNGEEPKTGAHFYNMLIDKNPYNPTYWLGLAKCYFADKNYNKAIEACDLALAADENFQDAHLIKAHSLFNLDNLDEAIEEYKLSLEAKILPPEFAYMFIGLVYSNKEEWEISYEYYQKALSLLENNDIQNNPLAPEIFNNQAICAYQMGRSEEAHSLCARMKDIDPQSVDAYILEGRVYFSENEIEKGREQWDIALQIAPEADTWVQIANHSLDRQQFEYARFCLEEARKLEPDYPNINDQLAAVCILLKDSKGLREYMRLSNNMINMNMIKKSLKVAGVDKENFLEDILKFIRDTKKEDADNENSGNEQSDENNHI